MALKRGLVAAGLSAFLGMGTGQAYAGRPRRGAVFLAAWLASALAITLTLYALVAYLAIWLTTTIDAFRLGRRATDKPRWRVVLAFIGVFVGCVSALRGFVVEGFKLPSSSMMPTLEIGDHVFINKLASIEVGDVIVFRYPCAPDRDYLKRVVARGGDTVEVRCNVLHVNGTPVPNRVVAASCSYDDYDLQEEQYFSRSCSRYRETLGGHTYEVFHDAERPARDEARGGDLQRGDLRDFPLREWPGVSCMEGGPDVDRGRADRGQVVETKPATVATVCEPQLHYVVPPDHVFVLGDNRSNSNDSRQWGAVPVSHVKGKVLGIWLTDRPGHRSLARFGPIE